MKVFDIGLSFAGCYHKINTQTEIYKIDNTECYAMFDNNDNVILSVDFTNSNLYNGTYVDKMDFNLYKEFVDDINTTTSKMLYVVKINSDKITYKKYDFVDIINYNDEKITEFCKNFI